MSYYARTHPANPTPAPVSPDGGRALCPLRTPPSGSASLLLAGLLLFTVGCANAPALTRYETAMAVYTAANHAAADLFEDGRISAGDLIAFRRIGTETRKALDAWGATISADGKESSGALEAIAQSAMQSLRTWLANARSNL